MSGEHDHLADNIKALRETRGLSQQQMAKAAGIPRATWTHLESGAANPTLAVLVKVAAALQVRLDELVTTKVTLNLDTLLSDDSTFYGDLFAHVVQWRGVMYLEDGLHRAVRAALQQRPVLHARVLVIS